MREKLERKCGKIWISAVLVFLVVLLLGIPSSVLAVTKEEGDLVKALEAVKADPSSAVAYNNLGLAYRKLGRFEEAAAAYRKALELDASLVVVYRNLGVVCTKLGALEEALQAFRKAVTLNPDHAPTQANLGAVLLELGRYAEAEAALKKALALDSSLDGARENLKKIGKTNQTKAVSPQPTVAAPKPVTVTTPTQVPPRRPVFSARMAGAWEKLTQVLEQTRALMDKHKTLPEATLLGEDQRSNNEKINALLQEAITLLLNSEANDARERMVWLQREIPSLRMDIENLKIKKISAPQEAKWPWEDSVSDIEKKIEALQGKIESSRREISRLQEEIGRHLRSYGLNLSSEALDVLLASVLNEEILKNAIVFENVKAITVKLAELTAQSEEELTLARRYYGMYVVLVDVLLEMQKDFVDRIDKRYLPKLSSIRQEALVKRDEISAYLNSGAYNESQRRVFKANQEALELNMRAAEKYAELLRSQRDQIEACKRDLEKDRHVAVSTYETAKLSSELSSIIRGNAGHFDKLMTLQLPEIKLFENKEIRKEFQSITEALSQSGGS